MYQKTSARWTKHLDFILLDLICLQVAFVLAFFIRHNTFTVYQKVLYRNMGIFLLLADIVVIFFGEAYKNVLKRSTAKEIAAAFKHTFIIIVLSTLYLFTTQEGGNYSRIILYITWGLYAVLSIGIRFTWKAFLHRKMKIRDKKSILIIASKSIVGSIIDNFYKNNYRRNDIKGLVITDSNMTGKTVNDIPVVASLDNVSQYVCHEWVDEVFVNLDSNIPDSDVLIDQLTKTGVTVHLNLAKVSNMAGKKQFVEKLGDYSVLTISINYITEKQAFMKRLIDILGALVGCVLTCFVFVFIWPFIYIASPGPIIFSQIRVGKNGKRFKLYKFRSMYLDAEERKKELMKDNRIKDGLMFKLDFDTRIIGNKILPSGEKKTGIGNFIRKTSLDEFPQFFNVLKGDMSLVGTRPPTVDEWEKYDLHHRARLATKPGITGMWQVSGRSNITDFEKVVELDTKYINEWSIGLDFKIILKTVIQALKRDGSM